jgi:hypothetical protein
MILVVLTTIYGSWRKDHQRMHDINISEEPSSGYSGRAGVSETVVPTYQTILHHIPEDSDLNIHCHENFRYHTKLIIVFLTAYCNYLSV